MMEVLILWTSYVLIASLIGLVVTHYIRKAANHDPDASGRVCFMCKNCVLKNGTYMCERIITVYEMPWVSRPWLFGPCIEERNRTDEGACGPTGRFFESKP